MKKRLFFTLVLLTTGVFGAMAQQTLAVLTHGTTTKTFDGYNALQDAYAEASSGDLITLSSGTFGSITTIEKAITIRGAGMAYDEDYHSQPTIISGNMTLALPATETGRVLIEGIFHNDILYYKEGQKNPQFVKCRLGSVDRLEYIDLGTRTYGKMTGAHFLQCKIVKGIRLNVKSSASLINCYVRYPYSENDTTSVFFMKNCNIDPRSSSNGYGYLYSSTCVNCIFMKNSGVSGLPLTYNDNTLFSNCLIFKVAPDKSKNSYWTYETMESVFKTYVGSYTDDEQFLLRDEVKSIYCDEDGREVGMNGGDFPFNARVSGPHLRTFSVDSHSTTDGKLRVRMQVDTTIE